MEKCKGCVYLEDYCVLIGVPADEDSVSCPSKKVLDEE